MDAELDSKPEGEPADEESGGGLAAAHRGYVYQDVATAYFLAKAVAIGAECVIVDRKQYDGDLFDDLTIEHGGKRSRRQFKSSADADKQFAEEVLKTKTSDLRIDDIVHCFLKAADNPADEYRICSTWAVPTDPEVARLLSPCDAEPSFDGHATKLFRLNVEEIWPDGGALKWKLRAPKAFDRQALISFCERLIVELECPQITLDLAAPGRLQILLQELLSNRIGVGRFPNQGLNSADAAIRLTYRANLARAGQESVTPVEVLRDLGVRTDFGRVAQRFPVIRGHFVSRHQALNFLLELVTTKTLVGLIGSPGAGKSWILTRFADYCAKAGFVVTRHYCYLEPGDDVREKRITSDVFFGNLIAELHDSLPSLESIDVPRYSAGPEELVKLLTAARRSNPGQRIVLIVDGLDHIERVLAEAAAVPRAETRIVDELANLDLPDGVSIVIGSQPGDHLTPLRDHATFLNVPSWDRKEIEELATQLGTVQRISEVCDQAALTSFIDELHARSEGNPLYATYLCRETEAAVVAGRAESPADLVRHAPQHNGDLNNYYRYLVGSGIPDTVSSILAYIDFAVTRVELGELEPAIQPQLQATLEKLRPILTEVTAQGGLRIYHESFRRFIVSLVSQHQAHRAHVLQRISNWLESRGFPRDSRSYRYLLAYLFKQDNYRDLLMLVGIDFVSRGVQYGYPAEAILDNLSVAADAARAANDWPALCRVAELRKSVYTCFEEKMDFADYTRANLAVNGAQRVAEQLLFDGEPTRSRDEGLIACSLCDDAGVAPPWREYLELPGGKQLQDRDEAALAEFHGLARTTPGHRLCVRVARWLRQKKEPPDWYMRGVLSRLATVLGVQALERLIAGGGIPPHAAYHLHIATVLVSQQAGDAPAVKRHAEMAAALARDVREALECVHLGADPQGLVGFCPNVEQSTQCLLSVGYVPDDPKIKDWIAATGLLAFLDLPRLDAIRDTIAIDGWYSAWMRFAISVAAAASRAAANPSVAETIVTSALRELVAERDPFRGKPRACDLYSIRDSIHALWKRALALIQSPDGLREALSILSQISNSTTSYLQGSPSGPLTMESLATLAEAQLSRSEARSVVVEVIESQAKATETGFYEVQASLELRLAAAYSADADTRAVTRWERACQCLTAYGYRRDITVFELIHSISCLQSHDCARAKECLKEVQHLVASLDNRTDGKDTKGGPIHWYESLFATTPVQATVLLARSLMADGGLMSWRLEACLEHVLKECKEGQADTLLALSFTVPPFQDIGSVETQLQWIGRILTADRERGELGFRRFLARIDAMPGALKPDVFDLVSSFSARHGLPAPPASLTAAATPERDELGTFRDLLGGPDNQQDEPLFPDDASPLQVMRILRGRGWRGRTTEVIAKSLGDRMMLLAREERSDEAAWLIGMFAHEVYLDTKTDVLAAVAHYLGQRGQSRLAAISYTLAGWYFRNDGSWFTGFDEQHGGYLIAGRQLDNEAFDQTIADRVVASIKEVEGYTVGISCRLIHIAGHFVSSGMAFDCWQAAYDVIRHRMPEWQTIPFVLASFEPSHDADWSLDEALCFLLLSRVSHPDLERKQAAITDFANIVTRFPAIAGRAIIAVLDRDTPLTSMLLILSTILQAESAPYLCTHSIAESLRALVYSDLFGLRILAERLLARIPLIGP